MSLSLKKVLYISCGNGLSDSLGGSFVRTVEIAKRLSNMGIGIIFLTTSGGYKAASLKGLKASYYILPASIMGKKKETWLGDRAIAYIVSSLISFLKTKKLPEVDLVYTDSDYFCDIIPAILYKKRYPKVKWCAMIHHLIGVNKHALRGYLISTLSRILQKRCWRSISKYADGVMVYDTEMGYSIRDYFIKNFRFDGSKIYVVTNGIDVGAIKKIPNSQKNYDAVMVGGLRPNKGLYDIIPIWKRVVSKINDAKLAIVGGSAYMDWLKKEIKKEDLCENILLLGNRPHLEALSIMKSAKIYITPSREEGWGIAVCEALACRLPVVAYNLSAYKRTFGGLILTVPIGATDEFARMVLELLSERITIPADNYKIISKYDWNLVATKELDIFIDINTIDYHIRK